MDDVGTGDGKGWLERRLGETGPGWAGPGKWVCDDLELEKLVGGGAVKGGNFGLGEAQIDG